MEAIPWQQIPWLAYVLTPVPLISFNPPRACAQTYESEMPKRESRLLLDFSSLLGPSFFVWVIGLPLPGKPGPHRPVVTENGNGR